MMTLPPSLSKDEISERFAIFRQQEVTVYSCKDYLSAEYQGMIHHSNNRNTGSCNSEMNSIESSISAKTSINECWRDKICEWSFQVIDHFDFNREIVSISLNYLDRYLSVCVVNKKKFQLAAVTCLYIALKLYGSSSLKITSFVELSRGYFTVDHIVAMEDAILRTLSWHMHPPTTLNAVRHFLCLFPHIPHSSDRSNDGTPVLHKIMELSRFLTELSVCDYYFVKYRPTVIGLAAVLTAMSVVKGYWAPGVVEEFLIEVKYRSQCDPQSNEVLNCKERLKETYILGGFYDNQHEDNKEAIAGDISPVCISKGT